METLKSGFGRRFDQHDAPQGRTGGLVLYPYSSVESGCEVAVTYNATDNNFDVVMQPGTYSIDGKVYSTTAATTYADVAPPAFYVPNSPTEQMVYIYLNPNRKVKTYTVGNLPGSPTEGDKAITVIDYPDYMVAEDYYIADATPAWVLNDKAGMEPPTVGHNNMAMNEQAGAPTASTTPEKILWAGTAVPPYVAAPSSAYLRRPASLVIAGVTLVSNAITAVYNNYQLSTPNFKA